MIKAALARKFIEQVAQYTDYNINIMNEQGVIIAGRDPERVGRFHDVAYYIITTNEDVEPLPFLEMIKVGERHSHEDISFVLTTQNIG